MPTPPTTRASRSRFSSPAVVGGSGATGARNSASSGGELVDGRGKDNKSRGKGNGKENDAAVDGLSGASASAARPSSTERSRRFMESWMEPERVRLTSFQEDGLLRQGVLETMEPLGTRPKPSMIKKLVGMAREGSPNQAARSGGSKKIILKRKKNGSSAPGSSPQPSAATDPSVPERTAEPVPEEGETEARANGSSTKDAQPDEADHAAEEHVNRGHPLFRSRRPGRVVLGIAKPSESVPASLAAEQTSSPTPTPTPKVEQPDTPIFAPLSDPPFLADPIKQSIEELRLPGLSTTPRSAQSIASIYDSEDDYFKRESSPPSTSQVSLLPKSVEEETAASDATSHLTGKANPDNDQGAAFESVTDQGAVRQLGPHYNKKELTRIVEQKEQISDAIESSVALALEHKCYADAYALRQAYADNQNNPRFLLQAEALGKQLITEDALQEWKRTLKPYKDEGEDDNKGLKFYVSEAQSDPEFDFDAHKPLKAPYGRLLLVDVGAAQDASKKRKHADMSPDDASGHSTTQHLAVQNDAEACSDLPREETQAAADEAEPKRVATPPRKRQKTQQRDSSTSRKASTPSASARGLARNMKGASRTAASPHQLKTRSSSNVSDVSSLSSIRSMSPIHEAKGSSADIALFSDAPDAAEGQAVVESKHEARLQEDALVDGGGAIEGPGVDAPADSVANCSTPSGGLRRAPARSTRNAKPKYYIPVPAEYPVSNSHFQSQFHPNTISQPRAGNPDSDKQQQNAATTKAEALLSSPSTEPSGKEKKPKRGMPNFAPQEAVELEIPAGSEVNLPTRQQARHETERLTKELRTESYSRAESLRDISPPERPETASSSSSLSSVPDVEGFEPDEEPAMQKGRAGGARATRANKRAHDEAEDDASPFSLDFGTRAGTDTVATSRAETPRPAKKVKIARRVKQSPIKKKSGPIAGNVVPTRAGNRLSPCANGTATNNQEENDDFCSFCAGNGNLVCCDGCQKAFHYMDHEPIVDPDEDAAWFCWDCMVKRDPSLVGEYTGPFGALMTNLDKKHAKAFTLPKKVREYFEGVRTGADGEYEEFVPPVKGKKKREADDKDKPFDYYQIVDKDNKPILCHICHESASSTETRRPIVPCSLCGLWWHADCLDPPKAQPPNQRTFVCPCHVDDLLLQIPAQLGPAHKFRKIKGSTDIVYGFRRGNVNNGYIEVDDDEDESHGISPAPSSAMRDPDSWGHTYRVRSSGVRDDFISKVGGRKRPRKQKPSAAQLPSRDYAEDAEERYEAALGMMAFARKAQASLSSGSSDLPSQASQAVGTTQAVHISKNRVEGASSEELEAMEAQIKALSQMISDERRKRTADGVVELAPLTGTGEHRDSAATTGIEAQRDELAAAERVADSHDAESAPISVGADDNGDGAPAAETPQLFKTEENDGTKSLDHDSKSASEPGIGDDAQAARSDIQPDASFAEEEADSGVNNAAVTIMAGDIVKQTLAANAQDVGSGTDELVSGTDAVDEIVDQAVHAALTPVSDAVKEVLELSSAKPSQNGMQTPETGVPTHAISPLGAEHMDLD